MLKKYYFIFLIFLVCSCISTNDFTFISDKTNGYYIADMDRKIIIVSPFQLATIWVENDRTKKDFKRILYNAIYQYDLSPDEKGIKFPGFLERLATKEILVSKLNKWLNRKDIQNDFAKKYNF